MLALRIDGNMRLGIRTAFIQFASRILDDRMDEAAADLRNALMRRMPNGRD